MKYLFSCILFIGCTPNAKQNSDVVQSENDTHTADTAEETVHTVDTSDTADLQDDGSSTEDRFDFPTSHLESTSTTYTSQIPELTLSLNGPVLSVAHGIFNADSAHDFASKMSVQLENSIIVVNYGLIDVPFGSGAATWYDLSYDVDISSLEPGTYRFRIVLDYEIADEQDTSVFLEDDIVYE